MIAVDVLAVMDRLDRMAEKRRLAYSVRDDIAEARVAMVESMEALRESHKTLQQVVAHPGVKGPLKSRANQASHQAAAALARCKGEK